MRVSITLIVLLTVLQIESVAQQKLYIGFEAGPRKERFIFDDPHNILYKIDFEHATYGLNIGYELDKRYTFETGFYSNPIAKDVNFMTNFLIGSSNPYRVLQVPLRVRRTILSIGNRIKINGMAGISYSYFARANCQSGECYTSTKGVRSRSAPDYFEAKRYAVEKHVWLAEVGAGVTYKFRPRINVDLTASYYHGFRPITRTYAEYYKEGDPLREASFYSKGSSTNFLLKLSYQLFDFSKPDKQPEEYFKN